MLSRGGDASPGPSATTGATPVDRVAPAPVETPTLEGPAPPQ